MQAHLRPEPPVPTRLLVKILRRVSLWPVKKTNVLLKLWGYDASVKSEHFVFNMVPNPSVCWLSSQNNFQNQQVTAVKMQKQCDTVCSAFYQQIICAILDKLEIKWRLKFEAVRVNDGCKSDVQSECAWRADLNVVLSFFQPVYHVCMRDRFDSKVLCQTGNNISNNLDLEEMWDENTNPSLLWINQNHSLQHQHGSVWLKLLFLCGRIKAASVPSVIKTTLKDKLQLCQIGQKKSLNKNQARKVYGSLKPQTWHKLSMSSYLKKCILAALSWPSHRSGKSACSLVFGQVLKQFVNITNDPTECFIKVK